MNCSNFMNKSFENFRKFSGVRGAHPRTPHEADPQKCSPRTKILTTPLHSSITRLRLEPHVGLFYADHNKFVDFSTLPYKKLKSPVWVLEFY